MRGADRKGLGIKGGMAFAWLLCGQAFAATNSIPDYGPAFGLFPSFGLETAAPDGQYAAISLEGRNSHEQQALANLYQFPLSGKGWVWPGENGQPTRYLFLGGLGGLCRERGPTPTDGSAAGKDLPVVIWRTGDADLDQDVARVLRILRGPAAGAPEDSEEDGSEYARDQLAQGEAAGALLLAAVHLHQAGRKDEANEIADLVFALAKDRSIVVRHAVAHLAQLQYAAAGARLASTRNWRAYRDDLRNVRDRFGTAWDKAPGLEILIGKVDQRIAGQLPAGEGIDADAARFFEELSPDDLQFLRRLDVAVVVNPAAQLALLSAPEGKAAHRFFARGIHMLPTLLAVIDSDYLLPAASPYGSRSYHYSSEDEKGLKSAEEIFQELDSKPPCLGDLALDLVKIIVPNSAQSMRDGIKSNAAAAARAFYEAHAADRPLDLATFYLAEGDGAQRSSALETLIRAKDANVLAMAETHLFSSNVWSQNEYSLLDASAVMQIHAYILQHPERAAARLPDFLESIRTQIPERLGQLDESRRDQETRNSKQLLTSLEQALRAARGGEKAAEEPADKDDDPMQVFEAGASLARKTAKMPPREAAACFLDGIVAQKDAAQRQTMLLTFLGLYQYQWSERNEGPGREEMNAYRQARELGELFDDALFQAPDYAALVAARAQAIAEAAAAKSAAEAATTNAAPPTASTGSDLLEFADPWKTLLADERCPTKDRQAMIRRMGIQPETTVADSAAFVLASIALDTKNLDPQRQIELFGLGNRLAPYWHRVAKAALDGTPADQLPPLPSAANVAPDAVSNLVERVSAAPPEKRGDLIRELDADSMLALSQAAAADKALRAALAPVANRIQGIGEESDAAFSPLLEPFVGTALSTNLFNGLLDISMSLATQSVAATLTFQREPWLEGATLSISTNPAGGYNPFGATPEKNQAMILALCQSLNSHDYAIWAVALPVAETNAPAQAAASGPGMDMQKMMAQFGVTFDDADVSPEMLAEMAAAMSEMDSDSGMASSEEDKADLAKAVDGFASGGKSPLTELSLAFTITLPATEGDDGNGGNHMGLDLEEMIIE